MKKIITSFLALSLAFVTLHAQSTKTQSKEDKVEHRHHHHGHGMAFKKLDLTSEQKTSMKKIREEFHSKISDLKKQNGLTKEQMNDSRKELRMKQREKMESVLTTDQKAKLAQMKSDWKAKHDKKGKEGKFAKSNRFKGLNLTSDQEAKIKDLRSDFQSRKETIKTNKSLSQSEKKEKMKDLMSKRKEEIKSILTPDQMSKWESMKKEHKEKETK